MAIMCGIHDNNIKHAITSKISHLAELYCFDNQITILDVSANTRNEKYHAYTLGAEWFERHFTMDRIWKGTDQVFSLEPTGMRKLVRDLRAVQKALTFKKEDILDIEKPKGGYEKYRSE